MAIKTWTGAALTGLWSTAGNWSPSGVPGAVDDVVFSSANNAPCTVSANTATVLSFNMQDYQGTVTINGSIILSVGGNVTLSTATVPPHPLTCIVGPGTLNVTTNSIITSNGKSIDAFLRLSTINTTIQLADAMVLTRGLTALGTPLGFINLRSSTPTVQRSLTLVNNGVTNQDIDYLNVTDINGIAGITAWTYKGTVTNCINWFVMTTQPPPVSSTSIS